LARTHRWVRGPFDFAAGSAREFTVLNFDD
jgi:hypothetical protein